jgi:hypothetical protein
MSAVFAVYRLILLVSCSVVPLQAWAQYDVEPEDRVWLRALLDLRVVRGGAAPSWTDHGPGKTRYGGDSTQDGFERVTRFVLSQLAIEVGASLPGDVRAQVQVNVQPDIADDYTPWLTEAYLRKEWGEEPDGWGLQAGVMTVPFSLEHTGPAWSPQYTISASALDSWLWEELNLAGAEGEWWHATQNGLRWDVVLGAGYGPDQLGRLVALRGWAIGDGVSGVNGDLPLPNGTRMDTFNERDHRPALYTWITLGDADERAALKLGLLDNLGDQDTAGVWHTRLAVVGTVLHPHPRVDFIAEYLRGEAHVYNNSNDSSLRAFYALLSLHHQRQRFSVRYDDFRVSDLDGGHSTREDGHAITAAYLVEWALRHRIAFEYVWLDSNRPQAAVPEPSQNGWQLSYRFRY